MKRLFLFAALLPSVALLLWPGYALRADGPQPSQSPQASGSPQPSPQAQQGRAFFELLGMLNDYEGRHIDGKTVEDFYGSEKDAANHFEKVLREYCAEEKLQPDFQRHDAPGEGHITFTSPAIAATIDKHYAAPAADAARYGDGSFDGYLDQAVFKDATQADLLRYVQGACARYGSDKGQAAICMADAFDKADTAGFALAKLGCTNVRLYASVSLVPTTVCLLFSPSPAVRDALGIRSEPGPNQLGFPSGLRLVKIIAK